MNKYRRILSIIMSTSILTGCSFSGHEEVKEEVVKSEIKESSYSQFTSEDGKVQFSLVNNGSFKEDILSRIHKQTLAAYEEILALTGHEIEEEKEILIQLEEGRGISMYMHGSIKLHNIGEQNEFLVHELVHALLGYDYQNAGYFTLDGLAMYLDRQITGHLPPNYFGHSSHEVMNYLKENGAVIPLEAVVHPEKRA